MLKDGTLHPGYNYSFKLPEEDTAVEFILNRLQFLRAEGRDKGRWLTNTESGEFITVGEVEPQSKKIASALAKRGMRHGDSLMYSSHEAAFLHVFLLGVWRANGSVRASYPEDSVDTLVERLKESKSKWFLCDPEATSEVLMAVQRVPWTVEVICFANPPPAGCTSVQEFFTDDGSALPPLTVKGDDIALILATSGTTGASKGAVYTQRKLSMTFATYQQSFCEYRKNEDVPKIGFLMLGRPTHITGSCIPFASLTVAQDLLMIKNVTKESVFHAVHKYRPDGIFGFPKYLLYLANDPDAKKYDFSSLKIVSTGGVVVTPSFVRTIESMPGVRVTNAYGMTECGIFTSWRNYHPGAASKIYENIPEFSVGKLIPGSLLQVRDPDTGKCLGVNQQGELCFHSPLIITGYYNRPEENKKTFPNGWIRTGDIGYFDEEGFVFVVDRLKEIFKYYNNHISPSELENIINRHPAVNNVCVVGIPDPEGGDSIPRAFVTLKNHRVSADEIRKFANDNLASFKRLRGGLIILPELPVGKTGKVERRVLSQIQISIPKEIST